MADTKKIVQLQDENGLFIYPTTTLEAIAGSNTLRENFVQKIGDVMSGPLQATGFIGPLTGNATSADKAITDANNNNIIDTYETKTDASSKLTESKNYTDSKINEYLPLTAGQNHKLTGALGLTEGIMYGTELPSSGFNGQLFFLEDDSPALPSGGTAGQILVKNSATDGDASWKQADYLPLTGGKLTGTLNVGNNLRLWSDGEGGNIRFYCPSNSSNIYEFDNESDKLRLYYCTDGGNGTTGFQSWSWNTDGSFTASKVYGAVWNDYAEYRAQKETIEPGYCVASVDNGKIYKTTEKFQACDGIVSDTFGFAIGETDDCKTPLAVAGRVLAYCEGDRYNYHSGDTVCAGPNGKICKMTREEIREWPDRIIGIVSEIPEYEIWGSGNIPVNGRIWIKIK